MEYKYKAFISYNHNPRDTKVAETLHRMIETYSIPRKLRDGGVKKPGKVFRDEEELSASSDLSGHIRDALDGSEFLIVICSPGAVASKWVSQEIAHFLENHAPERILTVLTGGNGAELYEKLLPGLPEPLSLDLTESSDARLHRDLKERFLKLCAPLLGREYDELVMRDQKRRRQRILSISAAVLTVAAVIIGILLWSNHRIEGKNRELELQNDEILLRESELLTQEGLEALDQNDRFLAVKYAVSALPSRENDRPYYAPAEQLLFSALNLFDDYKPITDYLLNTNLKQSTPIDNFCISPDGSRLATVDSFGMITCFDTISGQIFWKRQFSDNDSSANQILTCSPGNSILINISGTFGALSWVDGSTIWNEHINLISPELFILSNDEQILAVRLDSSHLIQNKACSIMFFSTINGKLINTVNIRNDIIMDSCVFQGAFSDSGTLFCGVTSEYIPGSDRQPLHFFIVDISLGTLDIIHSGSLDSTLQKRDVRMMFCEDDTALLLVFGEPSCLDPFTCIKIDLESKTVVWDTTLQLDPVYDVSFQKSMFHLLMYEDHVVIGKNRNLFLLDSGHGELVDECNISIFQSLTNSESHANIIMMEQLDDTTFAYILQNGIYALGDIHSGIFNISYWFQHWYDLGKSNNGKIWNGGFFQFEQHMGAYSDYRVGNEDDGMGFAAVLSQDGTGVVIKRPYTPNIDFAQTIITDAYKEEDLYQFDVECTISGVEDDPIHYMVPILEKDGSIIIRSTANGEIMCQIKTGLSHSSVKRFDLVLDDRYLLLVTQTNSLWLYDMKNGDLVFQHELGYTLTDVFCWEDPQQNRMYVIGETHLLCIDMGSWTVLTDFLEIVHFDAETGMIHRAVYIEPTRYDLFIFRLPTTEELVEIGKQFLGQ